MRTCNTCQIEYPLTEFYPVKQTSGNTTYRYKCKHCFNKKEIERYAIKVGRKGKYRISYCSSCQEWKIKSQHFSFDISKCNTCVKNELETIVEPEIKIVEQDIKQDQSPEFTPKELEPDTLYRECNTCKIKKLEIEYYPKNKTNCRTCVLKRRKKDYLNEQQGTQWFVYSEVGKYECDEQFNALYNMMTRMGWIYESNGTNEHNGTWHKPGFKNPDKTFNINGKIISNEIKPKKKGSNGNNGKSKLSGHEEQIIKYREQGHTFEDLADIYECSEVLLRTLVKKIQNEKK